MRRALFVLAITLASTGTALAATSDVATVDTPARRIAPPAPSLLVSDSAWLGVKTYGAIDAVQGFPHLLDLASCRRRVVGSCTNYDGHVPITLVEEVRLRAGTHHTLIVATGYNDGDLRLRSEISTVVATARSSGFERIVWLTLRANVSYTSPGSAGYAEVFQRHNATLREVEASGEYPELVVADWAAYSRDRAEWFAADGIHVRGAGPWAAADYISRKMAYLDGRPCPQPLAPDGAIADPCTDPDAGPPVADVAGLYPVGLPNPTAGFHMEWEGNGSWPAPPWWEG